MRNLNYELKKLGQRNRDGSYSTQANRAYMLSQAANQLHELGYRNLKSRNLKEKHIRALVKQWQSDELTTATIKNRMSVVRWWAEKVNQSNVVPTNDNLGIQNRTYCQNIDKSKSLDLENLENIQDPYVKQSLKLQAAFGLRREESIKIIPSMADKGDRLWLKASWTKGSKEREIPIETKWQRTVFDEAKRIAPKIALIQPGRTYVQQLRVYEKQTVKAGFRKNHGLRHRYAQELYRRLTGRQAPVREGKKVTEMSQEMKKIHNSARLLISLRLGHERMPIVNLYIGK